MVMKGYSIFPRTLLTGFSLLDGLISFSGHSSAEMQSGDFIVPADWAKLRVSILNTNNFQAIIMIQAVVERKFRILVWRAN